MQFGRPRTPPIIISRDEMTATYHPRKEGEENSMPLEIHYADIVISNKMMW